MEQEQQLQLFGPPTASAGTKTGKRTRREIFEDYDGFVEKFKPKKTTDDCYTPQPVYDAVLEFVARTWELPGDQVITRPFWPGYDFTTYEYPEGCVVVDNPPFSILAKIIRFYCAHGIRFFLFAPSLTLFTAPGTDVTYIVTDCEIEYQNGAKVLTGFITNLVSDLRIWCCPELNRAIEKAQESPDKTKKGFVYPWHLVTAATLKKLVKYGVELRIRKDQCYHIKDCSGAKAVGRSLYGGAFSSVNGQPQNGQPQNGQPQNGQPQTSLNYQSGSSGSSASSAKTTTHEEIQNHP